MKIAFLKPGLALLLLYLSATVCWAKPAYMNSKKMDTAAFRLDSTGNLVIVPSAASSPGDYNFLLGKWKAHNRRLKTLLKNSDEWLEFDGTLETQKALLGLVNREKYTAVIKGSYMEAIAIRLFDPKTRLWTDHWADSNSVTLDDNPVVGSFEGKVGRFFTKDILNGIPILVQYQWDARNPGHPVWSQAFSQDNGKTWEWNWYIYLTKAE